MLALGAPCHAMHCRLASVAGLTLIHSLVNAQSIKLATFLTKIKALRSSKILCAARFVSFQAFPLEPSAHRTDTREVDEQKDKTRPS